MCDDDVVDLTECPETAPEDRPLTVAEVLLLFRAKDLAEAKATAAVLAARLRAETAAERESQE